MGRLIRVVARCALALSLLPIAAAVSGVGSASATAYLPGTDCVAGATPNVTGTVTSSGSAYQTSVELFGLASNSGTTSITDYGSAVWLGYAETSASGGFGFCVTQELIDAMGEWELSELAVVAAPLLANPSNTRGTTSSSVNSLACLVLNSCNFNVAMAPAVLAGTVAGYGPVSGARLIVNSSNQIYASVMTDNFGRFAISGTWPDGSYVIDVQPEGAVWGLLPTARSFNVESGSIVLAGSSGQSPTNLDIAMERSRLVGRVLSPTGEPLTRDQIESVYVIKIDQANCPLSDPGQSYFNGCFRDVWISTDGYFTASVEAGPWFIAANGWEYFGGFGAVMTNSTTIASEINMSPLVTTDSLTGFGEGGTMVNVALTTGNFTGRIADPREGSSLNAPIAGSSLYVSEYKNNGFGIFYDQPRVRPNGEFIWKASPISSSNTYRFDVGPNESQLTSTSAWNSLAPRTHYLKMGFEDAMASVVNTCDVSYQNGPPTVTCTGTPEPTVNSQYPVYPYPANMKLNVCAPGVAPACELITSEQGGTWIDIQRWSSQFNNFDWTDLGGNLRTTTFQSFVPIPPTGTVAYQVKANAPNDYPNPLVIDPIWFTIDSSGVIVKCSSRPTSNECPTGTGTPATVSGGVADLGTIRFRSPVHVLDVVEESGESVWGSWVQVYRVNGEQTEWLGGNRTTTTGQIGLDPWVTQTGTLRFQADPPQDALLDGRRLSPGSLDVTVTGSSGAFVLNPSPPVLTLKSPNIEGRVLGGADPMRWTGIEVQKWNTEFEQWRWANMYTNTDRNGEYYLNLSAGRWRLEARAPSDSTEFTSGSIEVIVSEDGTVTSVNGVAYSSGPIDISLRSPNANGIVLAPGSTPAQFVDLQFQKWSDDSGYFEWIDKWSTSRANGTFGVFLEAGRYKVTGRPRSSAGALAPGVAYFKVAVSGQNSTVTGCSSETDTACTTTLTPQGVVVTLQSPNVRGSIVAGGQARRGSVQVEKWQSGRFEWINVYAESEPSNGFSLKLDDGVYRFNADSWGLAGFSRASRIVRIAGNNWCQQSFDDTTMMLGADCTPSQSFGPADFLLVMEAANVKVELRYNGQLVAGHSWANVSRVDDTTGSSTWLSSGAQVQEGGFWMSLGALNGAHYRVMVPAPNPNPNNLTRKQFDLWVGDYVTGGANNDLCLTAPVSGVCDSPIASASTFTVQMTTGNIQGVVLNPTGVAVGQVGINVMRREGDNWMWVDAWAEASSSASSVGRFSLDFRPDAGAATYQLTARPHGGTFSPGKSMIRVDSSGNWCEVTTGDTCTIPGSMAPNASVSISLSNPNVVGQVLDTMATPVRDAWVDVQRWVPPVGTDGQAGYRPGYWRYLDGAGDNTDATGSFQIFIDEAGTYRMSVNPPWNRTGLARFADEFTIEASGNSLVAVGLGSNGDLQFPSPNITTTLLMPGTSTTKVPDAWVNVVKVEGSGSGQWLRWTDLGGNSNRQGEVNLYYTEPGTYRLVVNPPWQSTSLARFTSGDFTIAPDGTVSGLASSLRFPSPNVSGLVTYKANPSDVTTQALTNGWVGVFNSSGNWIDGVGLRQNGGYELFLPDGSYTVVFYSNLDSQQFAPISKTVTVSSGLISAGDLQSSTDITFGALPPSIEVTVTLGGVPQAGAAVRLTSSSGSYTFQTDSNGEVTAYVPNATYDITAGKVVTSGGVDVVRRGTSSGFVLNHTSGSPIPVSVSIT